MASPSRLRRAVGTWSATAASQRDMNTDATEPTLGSSPSSIRRSTPRKKASAAAWYWPAENSSVTLTGTPDAMASSMAGSPSGVPGILMSRLGGPVLADADRIVGEDVQHRDLHQRRQPDRSAGVIGEDEEPRPERAAAWPA